jgi:hypothetical protein
MMLALVLLISGAACYALLVRKKRVRLSGTRFMLGVITGFIIVEGTGILLTEFFGYPEAAGLGFFWGFAGGAWTGLFLSIRP